MPGSSVDICSQALSLIGVDPISSFEDNEVAATCDSLYPDVTNMLLGRYPWRSMRKFAQLDRQTAAPGGLWTYQYTVPTDIVAPGVYSVFSAASVGSPPTKLWEMGNNQDNSEVILTDHPSLYMLYTIRKDEAFWPPHLYNLAKYAMAAELAVPVTEDTDKGRFWFEFCYGTPSEGGEGGFLATAKRLDSMQAPNRQVQEFELLEAHMGGTGWG